MEVVAVNVIDTLLVSMFALFIGHQITRRVAFLRRYSIPQAVTGGLVISLGVFAVVVAGGPALTFDLQLRDILLLTFFSTVGLSAKFSRLASGGKPLVLLTLLAGTFLILQNSTGVLMAFLLNAPHPGYGLFAGSVSLAGGHGTAIAWAEEVAASGLTDAATLGIAFATFGLIAGGMIGGPLAEFLIKRNTLSSSDETGDKPMMAESAVRSTDGAMDSRRIFTNLNTLALCISLGEIVNRLFIDVGIKFPGFLTAMLVGILFTNGASILKVEIRQSDFDRVGEIALQLFLSMSLMSMDLNSLTSTLGPVLIALFVQVVVITVFSTFLVFHIMGRTYDAAVICAGFAGLGLGATPVAIANMNAVTTKYGPSFKAFLVVPLVGAFFVDLMNAIVIKFFFSLPFIQNAPIPGA
ncbi:MAG: sodium/glutamate symporter [Myxococcota bacterium]